jgi:large subunit ribosomal protein L31e
LCDLLLLTARLAAPDEKVWERGSTKPPSRIRIRAMKMEDGLVEAELAEES